MVPHRERRGRFLPDRRRALVRAAVRSRPAGPDQPPLRVPQDGLGRRLRAEARSVGLRRDRPRRWLDAAAARRRLLAVRSLDDWRPDPGRRGWTSLRFRLSAAGRERAAQGRALSLTGTRMSSTAPPSGTILIVITKAVSKRQQKSTQESAVRERILEAAFEAFMKSGYAAASMLEIASRARVSKRELYSLVGNKQQMLIACITERSGRRLTVGADLPVPRDRETLGQVLSAFGTQLVREVSDPDVIAVFRLAIAEVAQAPEVARALDSIGRETTRVALRKIMSQALESGLLEGRPAELAEQFAGLLWRDLLVSLMLGVTEQPGPREIAARAREATAAFLRIHS